MSGDATSLPVATHWPGNGTVHLEKMKLRAHSNHPKGPKSEMRFLIYDKIQCQKTWCRTSRYRCRGPGDLPVAVAVVKVCNFPCSWVVVVIPERVVEMAHAFIKKRLGPSVHWQGRHHFGKLLLVLVVVSIVLCR